MSGAERPTGGGTGRRCAICGRPAVARFRPFCSRRCADRDLARWIGGEYRVETDEAPAEGVAGAAEDGD